MKRLIWLCLFLAGSAWAQTALTTTTLTFAVNGGLPNSGTVAALQNQVVLGSLNGVIPSSAGTPAMSSASNVRSVLFVDREMMAVLSVTSATNTVLVQRGFNGSNATPHNAGATVYVGTPDQFFAFDPSGACVASQIRITPWINFQTGNQWTCTAGNWTFSGGPYFGGVGTGLPTLPTTPLNVPQTITYTPGISSAAGWALQGIVPRESLCTGNVDTILSTDRGNLVIETDASACAVTLPQAGSAGFANNFSFIISNTGAGAVTITPTTSTINGIASLSVNSGSVFGICSDNLNYFTCSGGSSFPDFTDTAGTILTASVPLSWSAGTAASGNNPQFFRCNAGTAVCFSQGGATANFMLSSGNGIYSGSNLNFGWTSAVSAIPGTIDLNFGRLAAGILGVNNASGSGVGGTVIANGGIGVSIVATSAVGVIPGPVKADTANANQVVQTTTTDTGGGIAIGVAVQGCGASAQCRIITSGIAAMTLGTGTCSIGNFVIVDTTTTGRVQCTATYTAGTVIGKAMAAQNTVGNTFNVMVGLR